MVPREARLQDTKNRQNSIAINMLDEDQRRIREEWNMKQVKHIRATEELYNWAIKQRYCKRASKSSTTRR